MQIAGLRTQAILVGTARRDKGARQHPRAPRRTPCSTGNGLQGSEATVACGMSTVWKTIAGTGRQHHGLAVLVPPLAALVCSPVMMRA